AFAAVLSDSASSVPVGMHAPPVHALQEPREDRAGSVMSTRQAIARTSSAKGGSARPRSPGLTCRIGGVDISRADKPWWPEDRITKGEVARYYDDVADLMRPWLSHRP